MARILVVDDDQTILTLMKRALEQRGHYVFAADDAASARAALKDRYDALVCDIVLPAESGLPLMRDAHADNPAMAVVAISGGLSTGARRPIVDVLQLAGSTSAHVVLRKPFELPALVRTVEHAIAGMRTSRDQTNAH